jgi:hypothetical protein
LRKRSLVLGSLAVLLLVLASSAQAATITVGTPLTGTFGAIPFGTAQTGFNRQVPSGNATSPVDGVIVGWNLIDGGGGPFYLRVLNPVGTTEYTGVGKSGPATPTTTGIEHFPTDLPIKAGQTVAVDRTNEGDVIGTAAAGGGEYGFYEGTALGEGQTAAFNSGGPGAVLGFNAEVQPAPTITLLGTTSGPTAGGTSVTIAGTNFLEVQSVKFGSTAAPFLVNSEGQITASAPAASAGSVPVTVTAFAGTATAPQQFTYMAPTPAPTPAPAPVTSVAPTCKVPNLLEKKLKAAKKALLARDCKLGTVTKGKGVTAKTGKVVKQGAKAGAVKKAGSKVSVKLG